MDRRVVVVLVLMLSLLPTAAVASPNTRPVPGSVVSLRGTSHIWVAGEHGLFHWVADTRALLGRPVLWAYRTELDIEHIRLLPHGQPWLSASPLWLDGAIYVPRWAEGARRPELYRFESPEDLEFFGIVPMPSSAPASTRSRPSEPPVRILTPEEWQRQYGFPIELLVRHTAGSIHE
jgi:hypothetical protein